MLRRALRLVGVSSHLACGEVAFADGSRRGRVLFSERVERRLHEAETAARYLLLHATVRSRRQAVEQRPKREALNDQRPQHHAERGEDDQVAPGKPRGQRERRRRATRPRMPHQETSRTPATVGGVVPEVSVTPNQRWVRRPTPA